MISALTRYFGLLSVLILGALALGTGAFLLVLNSAYGILPSHLLLAGRETAGASSWRVALLSSGYSIAAYEKMQANHRVQIGIWSNFLRDAGAEVHVIDDADLEGGLDPKIQVLVVPGSLALSDQARRQVSSFVKAGGGLIVEGASGTRDAQDHWKGWDFIRELSGVEGIEVLPAQGQERRFITLVAGSPLTVQLPAGLKLENGFFGENYAVRSGLSSAYWSEWVRPAAPSAPYLSAMTRNVYGKGRVVWLGFGLDAMSEAPIMRRALLQLLGNALAWAAEQPLWQVALWPHQEQGAVNITFDCENDFGNLYHVLDMPEAQRLRFTFFMLSSVAQKNPALVKQAATRGEIAVHGDDHAAFSGQTPEDQAQRLTRAQSVLQALSQTAIVSFRPPEQSYDANTLATLRKLGLTNIFADYLGTASPRLEHETKVGRNFRLPFVNNETTLVRIPRPAYDDYDLFGRAPHTANQALELALADMNQIIHDGGLYVSSMHTTSPWGGLNPDKLPVLAGLIKAVQGRPIWVATVKETAAWWLERSQIQISVNKYSDSVILLQVTNGNDHALENLPLELHLPQNFTGLDIQSSKVDFHPPKWKASETGRLSVVIPSIKRGESKSYILTAKPNTAENKGV
ncbi:MAG: polysaccharide deacetylase family protein [Acidobacteria bacterium]|nr:polysaccharide deacetylase family protein [Acidobacteriota bacterium]MBI3655739.1 polysaccharide deacetylase family protein [Acidobacteriota bacterium]